MLKTIVINYKSINLVDNELPTESEHIISYVNDNIVDTTGYSLSLGSSKSIVFIEDSTLISHANNINDIDITIDDWEDWCMENSYKIFKSVSETLEFGDDEIFYFEPLMGTLYLNRKGN
jgi:hypothetical protein